MENSKSLIEEVNEEHDAQEKVVIPKGVTDEMFNKAVIIITSGFGANQAPDVIKSELFKMGVPFSKLNPLFNRIAKAQNLIADPKDVKANVLKKLGEVDFSFEETYQELQEIASTIAKDVVGASTIRVMMDMRAAFNENEVDFPKKPKSTSGRLGAVAKSLITLLKESKKPTRTQVMEAIRPHVKGDKNATSYTNQYHKILFAVANDMTVDEVQAAFAGENG